MKKLKEIDVTDLGIVFSVVGLLASVAVIVINFIEGESKAVGIALLCACAATLSTNVRNKKNQ